MIIASPQGYATGQGVGAMFGDELPSLQASILGVVRQSFRSRGMRNPTQEAIRERVTFCVRLAGELRRDLLWTTERIIDTLPDALKAHLDGEEWSPSQRQVWIPSDGF